MIVDASTLRAIILDEPDGDAFSRAIADEREDLLMSPVNFLETASRADKEGAEAAGALDQIMRVSGMEISPPTPHQVRLVREAYRLYDEGNHPAKPNLVDCFAYALSKARSEPLLFKGDNFGKTDVEAAL